MKFGLIQGDFSAGELSPRARGHTESPAFKAGLALAHNFAPSRTGSIASRAGARFLLDGKNFRSGLYSTMPVQHVPVHDSPAGDIIIEVSPTGMRLMDKTGVIPLNFFPSSQMLQYNVQGTDGDGTIFTYGDKYGTVYLTNHGDPSTVYSYFLTQDPGTLNANPLMRASQWAGLPAGTNEHWVLSGKIAGDSVEATVALSPSMSVISQVLTPAEDGTFSFEFDAAGSDFQIRLDTPNPPAASVATSLWDIQLVKNGSVLEVDTTPFAFADDTVRPSQERVRADSFWLSADSPYKGDLATFWVAFAGGQAGAYAGLSFSWTQASATVPGIWTFGQLPCAPASLALVQGSNTVVVYQDRLFFGNSKAAGRAQVIASVIGFMEVFNSGMDADGNNTIPQAGVGGRNFGGTLNHWFVFKVVKETYTVQAGDLTSPVTVLDSGGTPIGTVVGFNFHIPAVVPLPDPPQFSGGVYHLAPGGPAPELSVTINGNRVLVQPEIPHTLPTTSLPAAESAQVGVLASAPISSYVVGVDNPLAIAPTGSALFELTPASTIHAGDVIVFSTVVEATDPLNLTLATPSGSISWLKVLRGLALGTTRVEKRFPQGETIALDPATGGSPAVDDESNLGSATLLDAVTVNDRILFAQTGRKTLRMAGISITTDGGLVAEDVGVAGEHLTAKRIRSMCFLKSPVQRVVMAFDDGTAAFMTLGPHEAFSRLTIPAQFEGVYNVAALNPADGDSQLWVGTENGCTLFMETTESDIVNKQFDVVGTTAPHTPYDAEIPTPMCADGWCRLPLVSAGGKQYVSGLSACLQTASVYVIINGQTFGPLPCSPDIITGKTMVDLTTLGFTPTWQDDGTNLMAFPTTPQRRPQEVYVGVTYPVHEWDSLPLEGGDPTGSSQSLKSRKVQLYLRFVDSYMPIVNGTRPQERGPDDKMDLLGARVSEDIRCTEMTFTRGAKVTVVQDLPLRVEVVAMFGGTQVNNV